MTASKEPYEGRAIRAFAGDLTAWRVQRGLNKVELAERLGYDASLIGQIEACKNIPSQKFAEDCDTFFSCAGSFARRWDQIEEERALHLLPPGFTDYMQREASATKLYLFEQNVITGIFQTPEYAQALLSIGRTQEEAEPLVAKRMARQQLLTRDRPPRIVVVFDEGAIRRMVGGREVMRQQYRRLIEIAKMPNVTLHIIPREKGAHAGLAGAFFILGFEKGPDVVYTEGHVGGYMTEHRPVVQEYQVRYDLIRGAALSADETLKLLYAALENL
ncbi:helix-turn-helix domain-containing protein [Actinomadura oligospora]|uniref:helix-turn-helix domain-containing protein n=1 Tax=Actinomadura oligospora TaxID=111804 RepID=UPI000688C04C|nr:helix-turn-helix transcriptional regulator [Actinomadura oligospora]